MTLSTTIRRIIACIACMAMLFAALAPMVTHAGGDGKWAELCTMDGVKLVKISDADPGPYKSSGMGKHCAYCLVHVSFATPTDLSGPLIHPLEVTEGYPALYFQAPRRPSNWSSPQSRAPPAYS